VEGDFAPATWAAFRRQVFDGCKPAEVAAELGLPRCHPPHTAHDAARRIEELTGVRRKASRVRKFMKEDLGMKCLKVAPIPVPPKKTVEEHAQEQAAFLKDGTRTDIGRGSRR